jgi:hypothetical protein
VVLNPVLHASAVGVLALRNRSFQNISASVGSPVTALPPTDG